MNTTARLLCTATNRFALGFGALIVFALANAAPSIALGQTGQTDQTVQLDPFVVNSGNAQNLSAQSTTGTIYAESLMDIPFPVGVLTSELQQDFMAFEFNDMAEYAPSFSPQQGTGHFFLRGLSNSSTYVNGIQDLGLYGTAFVDRVELIYGANAAIYGETIPTGLRNVVTLQPGNQDTFDIHSTVGSDDFDRVSLDSNVTSHNGKVALRVAAFQEDSKQGSIDYFFLKQKGVYAAGRWDVSKNTEISFDVENTVSKTISTNTQPVVITPTGTVLGILGVQNIPGFPADQYYGFSFNGSGSFNDVNVRRGDLIVAHQFSSGLSARVTVNTGERLQGDTGLNGTPEIYNTTGLSTPVANKTSFVQYYENIVWRQSAARADVLDDFTVGSVGNKLLISYSYFKSKESDIALASVVAAESVYSSDFPYIGPVWAIPPYTTSSLKDLILDQTIDGLLVSDRINLFTDKLLLLVGGRRDDIKVAQTNRAYSTGGNEVNTSEAWQPSDTDNTLQTGVLYKPVKYLSLYGSYSQSFTPGTVGDNDYDGNPLGNQKGSGEEAGIKTSLFDQRLNITTGIFRIEQGNIAVKATNAAGTALLPANGVGSYYVTATELSQGWEENATYSITKNWFLSAAYGQNDAHYSYISPFAPTNAALLDRVPAGVPRNNFAGILRYDFTDGLLKGLNARVSALYQGRSSVSPSITDANGNQFYIPGATVWNCGLGYSWKAWGFVHRVDFNVRNVFNLKYYAGGPFAGVPVEQYFSYELKR